MTFNKDSFKQKVYDRIINRLVDNVEDYVDFDGGITIDEESVFATAFDTVADNEGVGTDLRVLLFEQMVDSPDFSETFDQAREMMKDILADAKEWAKGPMKYYGLKESDFI